MENLSDKTEYELSRILLTARGLSFVQRQEDFRKLCRSLLNLKNNPLSSPSSLLIVPKSVSSPRSGLQCGYCLKVITDEREPAMHVTGLHTNQAFQCVNCKNVFPVMSDVVKHNVNSTTHSPVPTIMQLDSPSNYHALLLCDLWDQESADCSLVSENGEVTALHSVFLESISPWFKDLRNTLCNPCDTLSINLPVSQLPIQQLVCLIYTGECFIQNLHQLDLIKKLLKCLKVNLDLSLPDTGEFSWEAVDDDGFTESKEPSCMSRYEELCGKFTENGEDNLDSKSGYSLPSLLYESRSKSKELGGPILKGNETFCSLNCNNNCRENISNWTMVEKREIKERFQGFNSVKKQQKLLKQLEFQENAGISTEGFYFKKQLLCVKQMSSLSLISTYVLQKVIKSYRKGLKVYYHGNESKSKCSLKTIKFCSWMKMFSERFGQDGPLDVVTVLPSYLNVAELYKQYLKEALAPHIKPATFYKLFKSKFGPKRQDKSLPWIRISRVSTHSRCDVCVGLDQYIRKTKNEAELEYGRSLKVEHSERYSRARIAVNEFIQRSINFPQEVVAMQIDSMDNSKSLIPRVLEKSKQLSGMFRLPCKVTGAITTSGLYQQNQRIKFFIQHGKTFLILNFSVREAIKQKKISQSWDII